MAADHSFALRSGSPAPSFRRKETNSDIPTSPPSSDLPSASAATGRGRSEQVVAIRRNEWPRTWNLHKAATLVRDPRFWLHDILGPRPRIGLAGLCSLAVPDKKLSNVGAHFARRIFCRRIDIGPSREVIEAANTVPTVTICLDHQQMLIVRAGTTMILG
jgi:hypothetical protein